MKLQSLNLSENQMQKTEISFWQRQFQVEPTQKQRHFDTTFGIVLPIICFFFDPIVFRDGGFGPALAGDFKPFAYLLSFVSIMMLLAFKLWGEKLKWLNGLLSGLFAAGAAVSMIVGMLLFPFSVMGLVIFIGILGFTPLFTAFVYWRNAVRAHKTALPILGRALSARMMILAALFSLTIPAVLNTNIQNQLEIMKTGNAEEIRRAAQNLKYVAPLADFSSLRNNFGDYDSNGNWIENEESRAFAESCKMLIGE
jgi:hypothetical protein